MMSSFTCTLGLPPRWNFRHAVLLSLIVLALTIPSSTAFRRHRHKHGRIPISNNLFESYGQSWREWDESVRHKRQDGGYVPGTKNAESGPWSDWVHMTACSRTCGGGVYLESRTCAGSEGACSGSIKRYSSCNVQDCPEGTKDFRAEQCARYNTVPFEGQHYSWIPYTKGPRRCELNCQPEGERFYYRHASKVVDGTRCDVESRDVCVDGECVPVGCDLIIDSDTKEDKCRVCGGDGTTCTTVSGVIDAPSLTVGYNDIVLIPEGATNILIEEVQSSNNYLALRNVSGNYYLNGNWKIDFPNAMKFSGTTFYYERKAEGVSIFAPEIVRSIGPINESLYLVMFHLCRNDLNNDTELLYQETNPGIRYEFSIPKEIKETQDVIYEWRMSGWGECSVSCGGGHITRNVSCVRSRDFEAVDEKLELCDPRLRPAANKSCNEDPCQSSWQVGDWSNCTSDCGTPGWQLRHVYCGQRVSEGRLAVINDAECEELEGPAPENLRDCNVGAVCPTWHIGDWSHCDKLCGKGHQTRKITCHQVTNTTTEILEDDQCSEEKPEDKKECEAPPCVGTDWIVSDWSKCKSSCGAEVQSRKAICVTLEGDVVPDVMCGGGGVHRKPILSKECEKTPECANRWYSSEWSTCSVDCGEGFKTRHVFCGEFDGEKLVSVVNDTKCKPDNKLHSNETCIGEGECSKDWYTAAFGKCSKTCGGGYQKRHIFCFTNKTHEEYTQCDKATKPFEEEKCNTHSCTEDELMGITEAEEVEEDLEWCEEETESGEITVAETAVDKVRKAKKKDLEVEDKKEELIGLGDLKPRLGMPGNETNEVSNTTDTESTTDVSETTPEMSDTTPEMSDTTTSVPDNTTDLFNTTDETLNTTERISNTTELANNTTLIYDDENSGNDSLAETGSGDSSTTVATDATEETSESSRRRRKREATEENEVTGETSFGSNEADINETTTEMPESETTSEVSLNETTTKISLNETTNEISLNETLTEISLNEVSTEISLNETSTEISLNETTNEISLNETSTEISLNETSTEISADETPSEAPKGDATAVGEADLVKIKKSAEKEAEAEDDNVASEFKIKVHEAINMTSGAKPEEGSGEAEEAVEEEEGSGDTKFYPPVPDDVPIYDNEEDYEEETEKKETEKKKCKPRPKISCDQTEYGCCRDGKTPAKGPFQEGCDIVESCEDTEFGCCPDDVSPAQGVQFLGCQGLAICDNSLFGCCSDNFTEATGPDGEGCENLIEFNCKDTAFGCCPDGTTSATGKDFDGCKTAADELCDSSGSGSGECKPCNETEFGCCPDGSTTAKGEDFEGCDEDGSAEGSASGDDMQETTTEILPDCSRASFGCCPDNYTAAHGENYEGCCLASPFGCCPDHISIAKGPNFEGCGCEFSAFGCCPDNETVARGPKNAGCGCQFTEFGCCLDGHTPSVGANLTGCPCNTYEFGCCPDGITIAKGPDVQGCGCSYTEFGCCEDGRTPAEGANKEGCGCEASQFGCCADGVTAADGKLFEGCEEEAPIVPGEVCGFEKDRGSCRNFTVKFYFDINYGGCTRFWYGGCEGNLNRFDTEEECQSTCVAPEGLDACRLPSVAGPCTGSQPSWYHDSDTGSCKAFLYRGCLGNNNRFPSRDKCEEVCVIPEKTDVCLLDVRPGPCRGNYSRWYYDQTMDQCRTFTFGGCKGNANNFLSDNECMQRCIRGRSKDICTLPKASGLCDETLPRWYFDFTETRCMPFYYTGCEGNANRFTSRGECEATCSLEDTDSPVNVCALPKLSGNCTDYEERYYYDLFATKCQQFVFGGCDGNENNFQDLQECQQTCETKGIPSEPEVFPTESCFLPHDQGTCGDFTALWHYDSSDGACKQFLYSGCDGNLNRFKTRQECENRCGEVQDICRLPVVVGPCSGSFKQYFYDYSRDECLPFDYSGCQGNRNRFDSLHLCQQRCQSGKSHSTVSPTGQPGQRTGPQSVVLYICTLPMYTGPCRAAMPNWYFDSSQERCIGFTYGGCSGNANRFQSVELCERQCGKYRNQDVCNEPVDPGVCDSTLTKWAHDPLERVCKPFYYTGCEGNGNRFSSSGECEAECIYHDTVLPRGNETAETSIAICELPRDGGPCLDGYKRWYFSIETGTCEGFVYGGCGGNMNRFKSFNLCNQFCFEASLKYRPTRPPVSTPSYETVEVDPCLTENVYCQKIQCPYGVARRVDSNNCERCDCFDPCENMICFQGSKCSVELIQSKTETYEEVRFEAVCKEVNKAGKCPSLSGEITKCDAECESDATCSGNQKCCYNGCAYVCVDPVFDRSDEPSELELPAHIPPVEEIGSPAVIISTETKAEVEENDMANLVCQADGNPSPVITWYKDGQKVDVQKDGRFQLLLDYTLRIFNTRSSDAGLYRCVASNGLGTPDEKDIELEVLDPTPRPVDIAQPQEPNPVVTLGNPIILRCWASGWPRPVFSWWRGNTMMPRSSEKYETLPLGGLRINGVTLRDLGPYTCQAYNGQGRPATNTFIIRALGPLRIISPEDKPFLQYIVTPPRIPTFPPTLATTTTPFPAFKPGEWPYWPSYAKTPAPPSPPRTTTVPHQVTQVRLRALIRTNVTKFTPFSDITLPCDIQGSPPPSVYWYQNNVLLEPTERIYIGVDHTLSIKNADESDAGTYKCEVRNQYGEASSTTKITVQGVYVHPSCTDNPFFANCKLIVKAKYCTNTYYARFCCRSCTLAGQLPSFGPHLQEKAKRIRRRR